MITYVYSAFSSDTCKVQVQFVGAIKECDQWHAHVAALTKAIVFKG